MKKNIAIAQIGRGNYIPTRYGTGERLKKNEIKDVDQIKKTGYTFEAVMENIYKEHGREMEYLILMGTETSYWANLHFYYWNEYENARLTLNPEGFEAFKASFDDEELAKQLKLEPYKFGDKTFYNISVEKGCLKQYRSFFEEKVTAYLRSVLGQEKLSVKTVVMEYGVDEEELGDNFDLLKDAVEEILDQNSGESVAEKYGIYFDISNGFRSLPMYIYTFICKILLLLYLFFYFFNVFFWYFFGNLDFKIIFCK